MNSSIIFKNGAQLLVTATKRPWLTLLWCIVGYGCGMLLAYVVPHIDVFALALALWLSGIVIQLASFVIFFYIIFTLDLGLQGNGSTRRRVTDVATGRKIVTFRMLAARFVLGFVSMYIGSLYGKFMAFLMIFMSLMLRVPVNESPDLRPGMASFLKSALMVLYFGLVLLVVAARQYQRTDGEGFASLHRWAQQPTTHKI